MTFDNKMKFIVRLNFKRDSYWLTNETYKLFLLFSSARSIWWK